MRNRGLFKPRLFFDVSQGANRNLLAAVAAYRKLFAGNRAIPDSVIGTLPEHGTTGFFEQLFQFTVSQDWKPPFNIYIISRNNTYVNAFCAFSLSFFALYLDIVKKNLYNLTKVISVDFSTKIKMAEVVAKMKEAELARQIGTTPQAFSQRMKTGKFKYDELEHIAEALGAELVVRFRFPDGTEV